MTMNTFQSLTITRQPTETTRRRILSFLVVFLLSLVLAACSGPSSEARYRNTGTPYRTTTAQSTYADRGSAPAAMDAAEYEDADSAGYDGEADVARSSSGSVYEPSRRPPVEERPGLGTVFGESVTSHATSQPFVRASTSPFALLAMSYNDEEGVRAHLGYLGHQQLAPVQAGTPYGGISVALSDEYGNLLPGGTAGGRVFVVGRAGQRYNVVLQNLTAGRYEVVASVDGLDVIDGRPADLGKRGYILQPYSTLTIDGFRRSEAVVAAFRFGRVSESYAARTSGDRNVGVVGVALFAEAGSQWTSDELYRRDTADPFPGDRTYAQPPGY